jgi:hypothetical protein
MAMKVYQGRTEDAGAPFLSAGFWQAGKSVDGVVRRTFDSTYGPCAAVELVNPVKIEGEDFEEVSIGNLAGFKMAMQAAHLKELKVGDQIHLECTGFDGVKKEGNSPRVNFQIEVGRDE